MVQFMGIGKKEENNMIIDIDNSQQILSHVLLGDIELAGKVAKTDAWKELEKIKGELTFNGVTVSSQCLEDALQKLFKQVEENIKEKYDADKFDERVEERARQILKDHADNVLDKIEGIADSLREIDDVIVPYWERSAK